MVRNNRIPKTEDIVEACQKLVDESQQLRRIAGLNILRAANIAEAGGNKDVVELLISEASVMMSVASQIEWLLVPEENNDANL